MPLIRLASNENPYGPAPSAIEAVIKAASGSHRYSDSLQATFIDAVSTVFGVPGDHVMLSGGSGDILRAAVTTFTSRTKPLVIGAPSYESPGWTAQHLGTPLREVPVDADLRLDLTTMTAKAPGAGLVYICNPNNPTSTAVTADAVGALIEKIVKTSPGTYIVVDEAYFEYSDLPGFATAAPLVQQHPQVIVVRTFSKIHAMAGMRAGYALASPKTIALMRENHSNSGMSSMTMAAAVASLQDMKHVEESRGLNREVRATTAGAFTRAGYRVAQSDANFIFVDARHDARRLRDALQKKGVAVGRAFPSMSGWMRVSIGTRAEMDLAIPLMMEILGSAESGA